MADVQTPQVSQGWSAEKVDAFEAAFHDFLGHVRVRSKDLEAHQAIELYDAQRRFLGGVLDGLREDVHDFTILKARQLGISTVSWLLDIFYISVFEGIQGAIVFDTDANKEKFRVLLRDAIESLPPSHRMTLTKHDRYGMAFENGSSLDFLIAGVRKSKGSGGLGRSRAFNLIHATECSSWGDMEGIRSLQASASKEHPNRLYIWESTARGYNLFYDLWREAQADTYTKKAIFIGWWAKDTYRIKRGTPQFVKFGSPPPNEDEEDTIEEVERLYQHRIDDEQLAWYRALRPTSTPGGNDDAETGAHDDILDQEYPHTAEMAFLMSGSHFFSGQQLSLAATSAREEKFKCYRYYMGEDFWSMGVEWVKAYRHAHLKVWEEPEPSGVYIIAADPAYGSSDTGDFFCAQVLRAYSDGVDQVAEYCVRDVMTYQFAWVIAQLAGWYANARLILEINGPGEAVLVAFRELQNMAANQLLPDDAENKGAKNVFRNVRQYLYRRVDNITGGFALQWKTTTDLKIKILHQTRDLFSLGQLKVRSMECLEEMRTIVQEGSEIRAENNKKDDRVMAMAMAVRAWHDAERAPLVSSGRTRDIEQARKNPREEDMQKMFFQNVQSSFFAGQARERKQAAIRQRRGSRWKW